jgi:choline dehydrogenase-like flavoprotein
MEQRWTVVGGGVAGSVIAARLAEAGAVVTLVELGVDGATPDDMHEAAQISGRTIDGLRVRRVEGGPYVSYTAGSGLGGGSAINAGLASNTGPFFLPHRLPVEGEGINQLVRRNGSRASVAEVYLNESRSKMEIRSSAAVERVVMNDGQACGVELNSGEIVEADRVVLCAGALMSPLLLMKSGCAVEGLGRRLQDHPSVALKYRNDGLPSSTLRAQRAGGVQVIETVVGDEVWVVPALMRSTSTGVIGVNDNGEIEAQFRLCQHVGERELLLSAVMNVAAEHARRKSIDVPKPGREGEWLMDRLASTTPVYSHATGGCCMGEVTDRLGRVKGTQNLFVADSSIFPAIPSVNPMVPTVQLAETLSDRWRDAGLVSG